jgi:H/ACA ribonucleoprotein complex subunit 2
MAKTENDIRVKKEKKDKKRKADDEVEDVSEKKDKKKKRKSVDADGDAVMDASVAEIVEAKEDDNEEKAVVAIGALVPFANPLADEKQQKKVLKAVKKCMRRIQADWS